MGDYYQTVFKYADFNFLPDMKTRLRQPFATQTDKRDKIYIMSEINGIMIIYDSESPCPYFWLKSLFLFTLHKRGCCYKVGKNQGGILQRRDVKYNLCGCK